MAKSRSNIAPDTGNTSECNPQSAIPEGRITYDPDMFRTIWTNIICPTGMITIMFQVQFGVGMMIVEDREWCDRCQKPHYSNTGGFYRIGPMGEQEAISFCPHYRELGI